MAVATELQSASQGLAIGVSLIALFLGLRQWYEQRARGGLADEDAAFHRRQDVRRWLGVVVMATLAAVVFAGSGVPPNFQGKGNPAFVLVWLAVLGLIVVSLGVALWDWSATWRFAREKRRALVRHHVEELKHHLRIVAASARRERERESTPDDSPATEPES
ncbi:hypothetical protein [Planctomyces sp. SH-PL62]|uniref:hypothetical protein n=1 Tax=Planctomyces sp. SH-PL62 TaxID=1636152 RepID=UPI00078B8E1A|nr:hypothetical protein [Planctomyces sp. SH-PL62]AMV39424.1 hypothetical protein VT85_18445 [Planctomyces sp. SH-PL62]